MNIIFTIVAIIIVVGIIGAILSLVGTILKWLLIGIGVIVYLAFWHYTIPITIIIVCFAGIKRLYKKAKLHHEFKQRQAANKKWLNEKKTTYAVQDIDRFLNALIEKVYESDKNDSDYKFKDGELPYGRINAFLSYFGRNIDNTEVYYYSCIPSKKQNDLREYGVIIARSGIFVSKEDSSSASKNGSVDQFLPFSGLKEVISHENGLFATHISKTDFDDCRSRINLPKGSVDVNAVMNLCQSVISSKISVAYYENTIIDFVQIAEDQLEKKQRMEKEKGYIQNTALNKVFGNQQKAYNETKGNMGGAQSHGYAAEYANNTVDRLTGHVVESTAQVLDEHGRQVKNGADRTVDGMEIQTKYYKSAHESIDNAFKGGEARYIRKDGKMMQIEVPREQYQEALKYMQEKIDSGKVPNIEPGERAENYVRRGYITYEQAYNVGLSGTLESLACDVGMGTVSSVNPAGISALIVFAQSVWNGKSVEEAVNDSLFMGMHILGRGTFAYTISMQLSRKYLAIPFTKADPLNGGIAKGNKSVMNPVYDMSNKLAKSIQNSNLAHNDLGKSLGLDEIKGQEIIVGGVSAVTYFGPDVYRAMSGKISIDQLAKNSLITTGGIVGGMLLEGIPVVGGLIGVAAGQFVVQTIMDEFIEDDKVKMFRILKEEYLDTISISGLSKEEVEEVTNNTIANPNLEKILENMFMSGIYRQYARVAIMNEEIVLVMSRRKKIQEADYEQGLQTILTKIA